MNNIYIHNVIYKTWLPKLQGKKKKHDKEILPSSCHQP